MKRYETCRSHTYLLRIAIIVSLLLTSCSLPAHHKMYSGPTLPKEQVAFLVTEAEGFSLRGGLEPPSTRIRSVDGNKVDGSLWDATIKVELLPGDHTIAVHSCRYSARLGSSALLVSKHDIFLKFKAAAGHIYLAHALRVYALSPCSTQEVKWRPAVSDITDKNNSFAVPITILEGDM